MFRLNWGKGVFLKDPSHYSRFTTDILRLGIVSVRHTTAWKHVSFALPTQKAPLQFPSCRE